MRRHILIAMVGLTMFGCGEQNSLDNIEFVKRNLKNKNLHEKLLTTEQSQNRSAEHQSLFQTINNSYNLLQQSKTEKDPFKAYKLAFTARQTFYSKEADSQAILSAKKLPDITSLYRRVEPYFDAASNTDFFL